MKTKTTLGVGLYPHQCWYRVLCLWSIGHICMSRDLQFFALQHMIFKSGVKGRGTDRWWERREDCDEVVCTRWHELEG